MAITVCLLGNNGSVHVQKWIKALALNKSLELHVVTFRGGKEFEGVKYHYLQKFTGTKLDYIFNIFRLKKMLRVISPQIFHAHYATSYGFMGAVANQHPYVVTGWGADVFDSPKNPIMKWVLKYVLKKADAITVLSKITQKEISKYTNKSVGLIPFGVDLAKFNTTKKLRDQTLKVGTIRTLSSKYGIVYLIDAIASLASKYPNLRLEIVGDGPLRQSLEQKVLDLKISNLVTFHGYVNQNQTFEKYIELLSSFDVFVIPSILDSETFGVASVEASACALPVVATRVGGLPEVVMDNITGILVPPKNSKAIADALEYLILHPSESTRMGLEGRKFVEANYNWDENVKSMVELYHSLT